MNFRRRRPEEPEINLIPFIDVLLVVLIFLMLSTTYTRFTELQVTLPNADAESSRERPHEVVVAVSAEGRYAIDQRPLDGRGVDALVDALRAAARGIPDPVVVVSADANSAHQSVVNVLDAARRANLTKLTFATRSTGDDRHGGAR